MSTEHPLPASDNSARPSLGRVLAAVWLCLSQAILVGSIVLVLVVFSAGFFPFASVQNDPTFGPLSGIGLKGTLPFLGSVVVWGVVLGIVVGSWTLWARRRHGLAALVSSLPLLLVLLTVVFDL